MYPTYYAHSHLITHRPSPIQRWLSKRKAKEEPLNQ